LHIGVAVLRREWKAAAPLRAATIARSRMSDLMRRQPAIRGTLGTIPRERSRKRLLNAAKKYRIVPVGFIAGQLRSERDGG
jgi:hypothetical protein